MSEQIIKTFRFLKEFFTAYTIQSKIYNCHENGILWLHEKGHIERFKNHKWLNLYANTIFWSAPALALSELYYPISFNFIILFWAFILLGFELDAWIYAIKHR